MFSIPVCITSAQHNIIPINVGIILIAVHNNIQELFLSWFYNFFADKMS